MGCRRFVLPFLFVPAVEEIGGVVVARGIVTLAEGVHAALEIREVLAVVGPAHLGDGGQTRQQHVFQVRGRKDIFRPEVRLHAENDILISFLQYVTHILKHQVYD